MRAIVLRNAFALLRAPAKPGLALLFVLLAACGAQPNQPVLANVPRPNPAAVAGAAAATAAAITLASPDSHTPEKRQQDEKKPVKVKENVPASVLDRLDKAEASPGTSAQPSPSTGAQQPAGAKPMSDPKAPRDALDFGQP
jgi:hypothetical protein